MATLIHHFQILEGDVEIGIEVRRAIASLGGVADLNPTLKNWEARFAGIDADAAASHGARVVDGVRALTARSPVPLRTTIESPSMHVYGSDRLSSWAHLRRLLRRIAISRRSQTTPPLQDRS